MKQENQEFALELIRRGDYTCDKRGNVYSHKNKSKGKPNGPHAHPNGYTYVSLCLDGRSRLFRVHQVVWLFFRGPIPHKLEINHRNGVRDDNRILNLELVTHSENISHAYRLGLCKGGVLRPSNKLSERDVLEIRRLYALGNLSRAAIARLYRVGPTTVWDIVKRNKWKHI